MSVTETKNMMHSNSMVFQVVLFFYPDLLSPAGLPQGNDVFIYLTM